MFCVVCVYIFDLVFFCVNLLNYFNWVEISTINLNFLYLDSIISWEDSSFILNNDFFIFFSLFCSQFSKVFFSLNTETPTSVLDLITLLHYTSVGSQLLHSFYTDLLVEFFSLNFFLNYVLFSTNGDSFISFFSFNNEISFFFLDYIRNFNTYAFLSVSSVYDSFFFTNTNSFLDFFVFNIWLLLLLIFITFFLNIIAFSRFAVSLTSNFFLSKFFIFANNFAFENRFQLDWVLTFLLFIIIIWVPVLMTYDDVNVEIVELTHLFICLFFVFIIIFLLYKYSIHYFSFLENSVSDGYSTSYIAKQFVRDVSSTFALFLRFFLLLFRLNIYDGLDDFLDSYYIFFIDFDEDSYTDELFFFSDFLFFSDNREDIIFYQPTEFDWWLDLYSKYFIIFGKIFYFWAFILEEAFRITLAIYISYLIIFEVHAVNVSNTEDCFFLQKRNKI